MTLTTTDLHLIADKALRPSTITGSLTDHRTS